MIAGVGYRAWFGVGWVVISLISKYGCLPGVNKAKILKIHKESLENRFT
jgi:hypothetical protein